MAYFAPYIDSSGFHMPTYQDIVDDLIANAQTIFGSNIYLGVDSQDYQFISVIANKLYDSYLTGQLTYNNFGPGSAVGVGLDGVVKLNGIKRLSDSYSIYNATLTGTAGTTINNGSIVDSNGVKWYLPSTITLGGTSTATTLTCESAGPISIGSSLTINTPVYGWNDVTIGNLVQNGANVETDSQLRGRQGLSVAINSKTPLDALKAALAAVQNMTRFRVYENYTSTVDSNGLPANSITCVVEGGSDTDIANTIYQKRGIGCNPNGTTQLALSDAYGQTTLIGFYRPAYVDVDIVVNVKMLPGYTTSTTGAIKTAIANFLNGFSIGTSLNNSGLWAAAMSANQNLNSPTFSITSLTDGVHGGAQGTSDLAIAFNQVLRGNINYIAVNAS